MPLFRLIILGLIIWAALTLYRRLRKHLDRKKLPDNTRTQEETTIVRCHHCGLHVPRDEAIEKNGRHYCCVEHAD